MCFFMLGMTQGSLIYSRTGTSLTYTQVIVQILHLTHVLDGQLRQENLEQVHFSRDFERENLVYSLGFEPSTFLRGTLAVAKDEARSHPECVHPIG